MLSETELIRKLDFFQPLDQEIVNQIAKMCILKDFAVGDYIVKQGESGLGLYFITRGRAKVEITRNGTRMVVAELQGGDFLGELSMIDDQARSADVVCTEETECMLLTREAFTTLINKHPQIAIEMAKSLVRRIRTNNERTSIPSLPSALSQPTGAPAAAADSDSGNGSPIDLYTSTKTKTRDFLVDTFNSLSALKMMTRFSAAIVGCPVTVEPERRHEEVVQTNICGVKLTLFPSVHNQVLVIKPFGDGDFSATVIRSPRRGHTAHAIVDRFEGKVRKNEIMRLHIPATKNARLEHL